MVHRPPSLSISPFLCLYPSLFQISFCVPTKQTTSVQTSAGSHSISTHLPHPSKNPNVSKHGKATQSSASALQGGGKVWVEKAPQTTLLQTQRPGAQASCTSQVHQAQGESLKGEGTSTGLLTVFSEGVVPHLPLYHTLARLSCNAPLY